MNVWLDRAFLRVVQLLRRTARPEQRRILLGVILQSPNLGYRFGLWIDAGNDEALELFEEMKLYFPAKK